MSDYDPRPMDARTGLRYELEPELDEPDALAGAFEAGWKALPE